MKILMTYPYLTGKGGIETVVTKVLNNAKKDMEFELLLPGGSQDKNWLKNINNQFGRVILHDHKSYFGVFFDTLRYIKNVHPDIVITLNNLQILPIIIAKKLFVPKMKIYAWPQFSLDFSKGNQLLKYCDSYLAISSGIKKDLKKMRIDSQKIYLIYNPINQAEVLIPQSQRNEKKHFVYVGRLEEKKQKNLSELYEILSKIKNNNWILDIYGSGADEPKLKELSRKLGIQKKIEYYGWKKNVWSTIKVADLVFLTSKYEGFGLSIAEAIAHGIPCIATDCPVGPDDIIKEGVNGHLYEIGDIQDAANTVDGFLNGEIKFESPEKIKESANKFYTDVYMKRLFNILENKL